MGSADTVVINAFALWVALAAVFWSMRRLQRASPGTSASEGLSSSAVGSFYMPFMLGLAAWASSYSLHAACEVDNALQWCSDPDPGQTDARISTPFSAAFQLLFFIAALGLLTRDTRIHQLLPTQCGHGRAWVAVREVITQRPVRWLLLVGVALANSWLISVAYRHPDAGFTDEISLHAQMVSSTIDFLCIITLAFALDWELNFHKRDPVSTALSASLFAYGSLQLGPPIGMWWALRGGTIPYAEAAVWFRDSWMPRLRTLTFVAKALLALSVISLPGLVGMFLKYEADRNEIREALRHWNALTRHSLKEKVHEAQILRKKTQVALREWDQREAEEHLDALGGALDEFAKLLRSTDDLPPAERLVVDSFDLAQTLTTITEPRFEREAIRLTVACVPNSLAAGDHTVAADAMSRLIENAIAAHAAHMSFTVVPDGDLWHVDVVDDGDGIPDAARPRLFMSKGRGIAAARYVLSLINADLQLISSAPGRTHFRVTFASFTDRREYVS